MKTERCGEDIK